MNLSEYAAQDALGLAALIARREVTAAEVRDAALAAFAALAPRSTRWSSTGTTSRRLPPGRCTACRS